MTSFAEITDRFFPISLKEMGKVRLMNRIDTKYVTSIDRIAQLLIIASEDYMMQNIDGKQNMPYYTCYYDTPDADMFYQHHRGKKNRQKIRTRLYEGSDTPPFIEVKTKNNKGRTRKKRMLMNAGTDIGSYTDFISENSHYGHSELLPRIENHFYRITLVNRGMTERVTIDTGLEFHNLRTDLRMHLDRLGIIEWKRDGRSGDPKLGKILRDLRIQESGFSKYCMGMAMTDPELKQNRFKERLRMINRISPFM